ncbi:hypothetical protein BJY00DRAFT_293763 [Aspergillus carlsbadensis]|nr:hypothetical protein BJY00DRAFT_293763 [Aspergillus carlsbadensis]
MISSSLKSCMKLFVELIESDRLIEFETEVSVRKWEDELGRLRVWAANIGAHQSGQSSLDYRLRDASHLKMETTNLLNSLLETLQDLHEAVDAPSDPEDEDEFDELYEGDMTEVQQIYQAIVDVINYLYRMSMAIRQPARHDQLLETRMIDATVFVPWAERHVSDKYPDLEPEIAQRLGAAMARQRAVLKYRERHRAKLGQGVEGNEEPHSHVELMSETAPTEFIEAPENHLQFLDGISDSGMSRTSYATTLVASQDGVPIPPPPPESADRAPFECPYCFVIISVKDRKDWARHIFRDVMPYTCIYLECTTPSKVYENRRQWYHHLCIQHALATGPDSCMVCPLCKLSIQRPAMFEQHVGRHLEELALFVLPRTQPEDESGTQSGQRSELSADEGHSAAMGLSLDSESRLGFDSDVYIADPAVDGSSREDVWEEDPMPGGTPIETSENDRMIKAEAIARLERLILEERLDREAREAAQEQARQPNLKFKDAIGRKYIYPWDLCRTWEGMEKLINQAFDNIEVIGPQVRQGHYSLLSPNGDIINPRKWESVVKPGWSITMHMWPVPDELIGTVINPPPGGDLGGADAAAKTLTEPRGRPQYRAPWNEIKQNK